MVATETVLQRSGRNDTTPILRPEVGLRNNHDGPDLGEGERPCLAGWTYLMVTAVTTEGDVGLLTQGSQV